MFDLTGKKALVTGASGGIGSAIASVFSNLGAEVVLSGTRMHALEEVQKALPNKSHIATANLSSLSEAEDLIKKAHELMGGLDILVCNAGITRDGLAIRMKNEDFEAVIDTNLKSSFVLCREAIKLMMKNKYGRIINISSIVGVKGNAGQSNYCASKAGLIGMSKALAQEGASRGITINCIAPGFISTPMTDILNDEQKNKMLVQIPSGSFGKPEDVAATTAFLASNEASYITGQTIHVNGGMIMV
jgi:3-oxoacyl-[acyl-carrier protein] reductase